MYVLKGNVLTREGRFHYDRDISCQDSGKFVYFKGIYFLVMADGAGSRKYALEGAKTAVRKCIEYVGNEFDRLYNEENRLRANQYIINNILRGLEEAAERLNTDKSELASTIAFAAVKNGKYLLFSLGDSTVCKITGEKIMPVFKPLNFGAKSITPLTTTRDAYKMCRLKKGLMDDVEGFIIMTDGIEELYAEAETGQSVFQLTKDIKTKLYVSKPQYYDDCGYGVIYKTI